MQENNAVTTRPKVSRSKIAPFCRDEILARYKGKPYAAGLRLAECKSRFQPVECVFFVPSVSSLLCFGQPGAFWSLHGSSSLMMIAITTTAPIAQAAFMTKTPLYISFL